MPRLFYEEKEQECIAKDEQIQVISSFFNFFFDFLFFFVVVVVVYYLKEISNIIYLLIKILNAKIRRLEHLLHLKDVRIQDLTEKSDSARHGKTKN